MPASSLSAIIQEIRVAESFLITTHVNPDGDAVGSMLALAHLLRAMGKARVTCVIDDEVPRLYRWLPGAEAVVNSTDAPNPVDAAIVVDVARRDRIGKVADRIAPGTRILALDHHLEAKPYGDLYFVDASYAAAGEIVVDCFEAAGVTMSHDAAVCAYVAVTTDTGGFRFSNTNPRTHRIAAALLEAGIDVAAISARCFDVMSVPKYKLLRHILDEVRFGDEGRLAYVEVTAGAMEQEGASGEDLDGLINFVRNIEGVEVAVLFREVNGATTKVSLRSRPGFNSAEALSELGGGGHAAAAGATLPLPLRSVKQEVLTRIHTILGRPQ